MKTYTLGLLLAGIMGGISALSFRAEAQVNLKSIGVGVSYWKPSLDYWNERSMLTTYNNEAGATFSGKAMPTASLEVGLTKRLSVGARAGYWKNSVSGALSIGGINRTETLTLSVIPVSLDLKYSFPIGAKDGGGELLIPYAGVGLSRYFVKNEFVREVASNPGSVNETQAGNSYGAQVFVGAERKLFGKLYAGLDVRYHLGSYNQGVRTETATTSTENVSLNGLEAGLSLKVKFH